MFWVFDLPIKSYNCEPYNQIAVFLYSPSDFLYFTWRDYMYFS